MVKIESKEKLAKLLAIEDLDIQHQQVQTAMFDIKNRCLILPIWKDIPNYLYDLFVGHEVGHALFTPTNPERLKKIIDKTSKDCVNVIEDARIEALIKRRYPGLKKQFFNGYNNLIERDFFGLSKRDINESGFLDRINIFFKVPQYGDIVFNEDEQKIIERIKEAKSFKDVEKIAIDVHSYVKENEKEENQPDEGDEGGEGDDVDGTGENEIFDGNLEKSDDESDEESAEESGSGEKTNEESNKESDSNDGDDLTDEEQDEETLRKLMEDVEKSLLEDDSKNNQEEDVPNPEEVVAKTQRYFDERVSSEFVDNSSKNVYINVPENVNLNNAVHNYKKVHNNINKFYNSFESHPYWKSSSMTPQYFREFRQRIYTNARNTLQKIKKDSVKNVNHIAMEFERKKAADVYKKVLVSKTGILDTNKLFSAKYNEDVFKKNTKIPDGKNHGLIMFIDWSGSMATRLSDCIKQVIELSFFCKKVNIPFEVYSFTDRYDRYNDDGTRMDKPGFDYRHGDLVCDTYVKLRSYLSSKMSAKEYNNALINLCIFVNRYNKYGHASYGCPPEDELGSTPLSGAILMSEHIIRNFKRKNNLESVHAVWLTDGEGNYSGNRWDAIKKTKEPFYTYGDDPTVYLKDKKTKKDYLIYNKTRDTRSYSAVLFDIVKDRLGINIVGFFLMDFKPDALWRYLPHRNSNKQDLRSYEQKQADNKTWIKDVKKDGYFIKTESGYDEYYVLNTAEPKNKKPLDVIDEKMTTRKMVNIFSQKNEQFKAKRVILSKFVDLITSK